MTSIASTSSVSGTTKTGSSSTASQIAALNKQIAALEKQLVVAQKDASSEGNAEKIQLVQQQIAALQARIAQIESQQTADQLTVLKSSKSTATANPGASSSTLGTNVNEFV